MPRAPKTRASPPAKPTEIASTEPAAKAEPKKDAKKKDPKESKAASKPAEPDPEPEMDPAPDDSSSSKRATSSDDKTDRKPDDDDDKPAAKPDDAKRRAEAELAYRDGEQRAAMGDTDGAIKSLKRAAELNPSYAPTYRALGDAYAKRGDGSKAKSAYGRYLKLAPKAGDARKVRDRMNAL
jgi:ribonuclease E